MRMEGGRMTEIGEMPENWFGNVDRKNDANL